MTDSANSERERLDLSRFEGHTPAGKSWADIVADLALGLGLGRGSMTDQALMLAAPDLLAELTSLRGEADGLRSSMSRKDEEISERSEEIEELKAEIEGLRAELTNIAEAKRFDREHFDDDTSFADWAQSRARWRLGQCDNCGDSGWHTEYGNDGVPCGDSPCSKCNPNGDALRAAAQAEGRQEGK